MGRVLTIVVVLAALTVPAALADQPTSQNQTTAAALCKAQRKSMAVKDFRSLWGTNKKRTNAFGNCVALTAQQQQENVQSAESSVEPSALTTRTHSQTSTARMRTGRTPSANVSRRPRRPRPRTSKRRL